MQWDESRLMCICVILVIMLMSVCLLASAILGILALTAPEAPAEDEKPDADEMFDPYPIYDPDASDASKNGDFNTHPRVLSETSDAGQKYIDRMIFVGESTTAHLRSRGVLNGGKETLQVWSDKSNTMTLSFNILKQEIIYPVSGVKMTIPEAVAIAKPEFIVLSFGINGIYGFVKNTEMYCVAYGKLIEAVHEASPETVVLLQTIYPVAANQTSFDDDVETINEYVDKLNALLPGIAEEFDAYVVDTASCLIDARGMLRSDYQTDGLHLNEAAYREILNYMRTHAYTP